MLNIYFGDMPEAIYDTASYFNNTYLDKWLKDAFSQKIIKAIDKAKVISTQAIESKALGVIPVTGLSGGAKALLLIHHEPQKVFNASTCGDNCAKWILEIAKKHEEDITINLRHLMDFDRDGKAVSFEIRILNSGKVVHNMAELVMEAGIYLQSEG